VQSVASEPSAHTFKPPSPHPRPLTGPDRAASSPFESLLDDGTQTPAPAQTEPNKTAGAERSRPRPPDTRPPDGKSAGRADPADPVKADNSEADRAPDSATSDQTAASNQATADTAGKAVSNTFIAATTADAGNSKAEDKAGDAKSSDDQTQSGGETIDPNAGAQIAANGLIASSGVDEASPGAISAAGDPPPDVSKGSPHTSKNEAPVSDPVPATASVALIAAVTVAVATASEPAPFRPSAAQRTGAVSGDAGKGPVSQLPAAQADDGKPANGPQAPAQDTRPAQGDGKPAIAVADADKQALAHARGETPPTGHQAAATDATQPAANSSLNAGKAGADVVQTLAVNQPSHSAAATNPAQAVAQNLAPAAPVPLNGVAVAIAGKALEGKNRFEIRLDPPELGRIEVRLDVDTDGRVTSHLIAHRAETLDLLRRDAAGLQRALEDAGLKTTDNGLQFSLRDQSTDHQQPQTGSRAAQLLIPDETPTDPLPDSYGQIARLRGGLDIRV
jgi:flagellar hook-length control protein FliK